MQIFQSSSTNIASFLASIGFLLAHGAAGDSFNASNSLAVYWGQNSYNRASGSLAQQRLATYCRNTNINIIPIAFMLKINSGEGGQPELNFANQANNCTAFPGTSLFDCPNIANDIKVCQQRYNKTILLAIGGATYTEGGFANASAAQAAAELVWKTFGPSQNRSTPSVMHSTGNHSETTSGNRLRNSSSTHSLTSVINRNSTLLHNSTALARLPTSVLHRPSRVENHRTNTTARHNYTGSHARQTSTDSEAPRVIQTNTAQSDPARTRLVDTTYATTVARTIVSTIAADLDSKGRLTNEKTSVWATATSNHLSHSSRTHTLITKFTMTTATGAQTLSYDDTHPNIEQREARTLRPFHDAIVDGFDIDLESTTTNFKAFAQHLRALMDAETSKQYYLTAAPQCVYPDVAQDSMLNGGIHFDAIFVQFYNNYCGLQGFVSDTKEQPRFNFDVWNSWAQNNSTNKDVKVFVGVPAAQTAAGSGYTQLAKLKPIIKYCQSFSNFGGVVAWDVSQAYSNRGFLRGVRNILHEPATKRIENRKVLAGSWSI